ncbi:MAG: IS1595 family transposase [Bacteroidia bacterium]
MEGSRTPLWKWFYATYEITQSKNCVSALELKRRLGITYKCAWSMMHKIRNNMKEKDFTKLFGVVEIDETWIGGRRKNKNKVGYNGMENKAVIMGIRQRGKDGLVKTFVIESRSNGIMLPLIHNNVETGSMIYTDEYPVYKRVVEMGYKHKFVNHKKYKFANGRVTTNRIESYWSYIKNPIRGTYKSISKKWLRNYLNEYEYRYNRRMLSIEEQFNDLINRLIKKPS